MSSNWRDMLGEKPGLIRRFTSSPRWYIKMMAILPIAGMIIVPLPVIFVLVILFSNIQVKR